MWEHKKPLVAPVRVAVPVKVPGAGGVPSALGRKPTPAMLALEHIYGVNDYQPQGFLKLNKDLPEQVPGVGVWQDPRPFAGEMIKGPYGVPLK